MKPVFFTHVPKTAGTAMQVAVFDSEVSSSAVQRYKGIRRALTCSKNFGLLKGHYPYGVHYLYGFRDPSYFVMLRHPIERAISHYHFIKDASSPTYTHPQSKVIKQHDLVSLYDQPSYQNMQTRFVAGLPWYLIGRRLNLNGVLRQYVLHKAKKNLVSQYKAFGLKERFEDSAELFATHIGTVPQILDRRIKKRSDRPTVDEISSETRSKLRANNKLDIALYDFATQCFDLQERQLT